MTRLLPLLVTVLLTGCNPSPPPGEGGFVDFPTLGGNWMIINYWAEWCAPCREEIPELNALAASSGQLDVYAVNFDGVQGEALAAQAEELGIKFTQVTSDPGPRLEIARPTVLPTTLILAPDGTLVTRLIGPQTAEGLLQELAVARKSHAANTN